MPLPCLATLALAGLIAGTTGAPFLLRSPPVAASPGSVLEPARLPPLVVRVRTGRILGAGTDATVHLHIRGTLGYLPWTRLVAPEGRDPFEAGSTDVFEVGSFLGDPLWVCVHSDGGGLGPEWYLESVEVDGTAYPFHAWIPGGSVALSGTAPPEAECPDLPAEATPRSRNVALDPVPVHAPSGAGPALVLPAAPGGLDPPGGLGPVKRRVEGTLITPGEVVGEGIHRGGDSRAA